MDCEAYWIENQIIDWLVAIDWCDCAWGDGFIEAGVNIHGRRGLEQGTLEGTELVV